MISRRTDSRHKAFLVVVVALGVASIAAYYLFRFGILPRELQPTVFGPFHLMSWVIPVAGLVSTDRKRFWFWYLIVALLCLFFLSINNPLFFVFVASILCF
jgi:hypothetical protein